MVISLCCYRLIENIYQCMIYMTTVNCQNTVNKCIVRALASSLWYKMCTQDFLTNMAAHTDG